MADYLEACIEESGGDSSLTAKASGNITRAKGLTNNI